MSSTPCNVNTKTVLLSDSNLSAGISEFNHGFSCRMSGSAKVIAAASVYRNIIQTLSGSSKLQAQENVNFSPKEDLLETATGSIFATTYATLNVKNINLASSNFSVAKTDKFNGSKLSFQASSKLYPIADVSFKNKFTNNDIVVLNSESQSSNIYSNIDEGIFAGNYTTHNSDGFIVSDDNQTLIFPSQVFNSGDLEYKFRVTYPLANPKLSYFAIRASAPFDNYVLRKPQKYKIYDIKLEDPSGNLITQYDDISIKGDNNFTTYISQPNINNVNQPTWNCSFPYMDSGSPLFLENKPYTLRLSLTYECDQYPFNSKFDLGYEHVCISGFSSNVDNPNPFNSLLISAIEIGSSGGIGIKKDNYLECFTKVRSKSERVQKIILPNQLFTNTFNNGIYPEASSIWRTPDYQYSNQTAEDANVLLQKVRLTNSDNGDYISLSGSLPYIDSGRLILKFNTDRDSLNVYKGGAFNFGGNTSFNDAKRETYEYQDYFEVDYAELKVIARKHSTNNNYPIDIVGYSDDKLLYVTTPVGGFLQNSGSIPLNEANVPDISGFKKLDFAISSAGISDNGEYFVEDVSSLGDHYILNTSILVDSTNFKEYSIPLDIYKNPTKLGYDNYALSPYFENLYIDICPIPSGASIAHVSLVLHYKPANAVPLHVLGSPSDKNAIEKSIVLLPDGSGTISSSEQPSGVVIGLSSPSYLSTNFARRWRGHTGDVLASNSFQYSEFDFSFDHKQSDTPFLNSYVDFSNINLNNVYDHKNNIFAQSLNNLNVLSNFGWRYSSDQAINNGNSTYKSLSWNCGNNIYDTFDRALRADENIKLKSTSLNLNDSFVLFIRYIPNTADTIDLSNHVILSHEDNSDWGLVLVIENDRLTLKVKNNNNTIFTIIDDKLISEYSYPLSILITYDAENYRTYKLYTYDTDMYSVGSVNLISGGVGPKILSNPSTLFGFAELYYLPYIVDVVSIFIHEIGYSSGCHIVDSNPNRYLNQITADDFFDSYNVLSANIDDDISKWHLGAFKICAFSPDFDSYTKREGKDYITFNIDHPGSEYSQLIDITPVNINLSGVSYHTQIENDFLRFDISDVPSVDEDRFYGLAPRISKELPKGYKFREEALCIDTVLEHETYNDFVWPNGKVGPKFVISLYSPTQESLERPSKTLGLVNRETHYLEPSGCIRKITTTFNFNDILDTSEPWALFDREALSNEFSDKYLLDDVNQMFLQYDLIYPTGSPYKSKIRIHNTNIRCNNAIYYGAYSSGTPPLNLYVSGQPYQFNTLNLFAPENGPSINQFFNLFASGHGPTQIENSGLFLNVDSSGYFVSPQICSLYTIGNGKIDTSEQLFGGMFGSTPFKGLGLSVSGQFMDDGVMPLNIDGFAYSTFSSLNLYNSGPEGAVNLDENLILRIRGINPSFNAYPSSIMSLHIYNDQTILDSTENSFNLYLSSFDPIITDSSGNLPLITLNYPISDILASKSTTIKWDSNNVGQGITSIDNVYAYVDADDNIRGVNLACYGECNK